MSEEAILAEGIHKVYGERRALDGFDLAVPTGMVYGLLGPNGAGKSTAVRILATLVRMDGGRARVVGLDVAAQAKQVRRRIGLAGQHAALDEVLTGRQNLRMFGRLFHLGARRAAERAEELLERFDLVDAADKGVKGYSGGMRRRLDLAASMILAPDVLFLDEPTTGLDPRGRNEVWGSVRALVEQGTTVLLTTQYLEEADRLAGRIAVLDRGRVIADGPPGSLKRLIGGDRIEVVVRDPATLAAAAAVVARVASAEPRVEADAARVHAPVADRVAALTEVARSLQDDGIAVEDIGLRRPTLDEVFLRLTGQPAEDAKAEDAKAEVEA
ncbi:ABC-2 type transport system ATP-binding protein [Actinomadura coerulea]|uniref:ABC-2 type transport system ATP-binding protein n=1 Tax=Actinomadura coerulea TaxID=46159 RepID=A0A7X0L0R2_9ACTN|nr:ATP-binding cassette domain-containing protein [Actinomadura coerulea]MBB6397725.1 ABC-2 type transport system ATP-binding protein [Actinomadura coerulea]GGQ18071.1 daunorubicin resistance protein DrrA family ABC transporter ATP-binding protein [Actinomadura coerulea]